MSGFFVLGKSMHLDSQIRYLLLTHAELRFAAPDKAEQVSYVTNYIGSKQKLVEWIWSHTPHGVQSVLDAFSGSSVVGYMYKRAGLRVVANDRLKYAFHIARAIIENNETTLSDGDIDGLLAENSKAGSFVQDNFKGLFFAKGVHAAIDTIRTNIDDLRGYKKDIALFALAKACISGKGGFGHFQSSVRYGKFEDTLDEFTKRFRDNCATINGLVYNNGKENRAENSAIDELLPGVKVDLAYFDPPYATEFSTTNYESYYHFVEGLMTYWKGLTINDDSATHKFVEKGEQTVTQATAEAFFETFLKSASGIGCWIISYRDHAFPNEAKIKSLIGDSGKVSRMYSKDHSYQLAGNDRRGDASQAKEHIFVCGPTETAIRSEADWDEEDQLLAQSTPFFTIADAHAEAADNTRVTAYMGSKVGMLDWIWKNTPDDVTSVLDLFSGGANVGYFYKQKGMQVVANDLLKYPFHIAKAVIENSSVTITDDDIATLLEENSKADDFIVKTFHGYYYTEPILHFLDNTYTNIQNLSGYKKNIAMFALGRVCLIKASFGEFSRSKKSLTYSVYGDDVPLRYRNTQLGNIPLSNFREMFVKCLHDANALVFDNGHPCKAYNQQALAVLAKQKVDLVYADPPYVTQFGYNDYAHNLHFVEGLMTYWDGLVLHDNDRKDFDSPTKYNKDSIGELISGFIDGTASIGAKLIMSYRDKAFPTAAELKELLNAKFDTVDFKRKGVAYNISHNEKDGAGKFAQEYLLIANKPKALKAAASITGSRHATITANITLVADAKVAGVADTDPEFVFVLTHVGTNLNGDNFTRDELIKAAPTAISRKVDLKHSQDLTDIVGGITDSQWKDEEGGLVECTGRLFVADNPHAQLAYRLMKEGIVKQVSMECQYDAGECSICGKKFASKADYCIHLRKYKGATYQGKPVFEILRGVVFTGVGLLSDKGADERAVIRSVAATGDKMKTQALTFSEYFLQQQRSMTLWDIVGGLQSYLRELLEKVRDEDITNDDAFTLMQSGVDQFRASLEALFQNPADLPTVEAKKMSDPKPPETPPASEAAPVSEQIKTLTQENADLKKQIDELSKQLDALKKATAQEKAKAKATELVKRFELKGRTFANDAEREAEIERLSALSEDAFAAVENIVATIPDMSAQANRPIVLKTDAGAKPVNVPDAPPGDSLGSELKEGILAAYKHNRGEPVNP